MEFDLNNEVLECARYGEDEDLIKILEAGGDVNFRDYGGSTALHKASANGHVNCLKILKDHGAEHVANNEGNYPIHWAAQNGNDAALKFLFDNYDVDVLASNSAGRTTLTEAFQSGNTESIAICMAHPSVTEERLLPKNEAEESEMKNEKDLIKHAVSHKMCIYENEIMKIRELPIIRADNPFGSDQNPEDDTTGKILINIRLSVPFHTSQ